MRVHHNGIDQKERERDYFYNINFKKITRIMTNNILLGHITLQEFPTISTTLITYSYTNTKEGLIFLFDNASHMI